MPSNIIKYYDILLTSKLWWYFVDILASIHRRNLRFVSLERAFNSASIPVRTHLSKNHPWCFFISYFIDGPWSILLWSLFYRPIQTHNGRCMWILIYQSIAFFKSYKIVYFLYSENLGQFRNLKGTILETWFCAFLTTIELISVKTVGFDSKQIIYLESASKTESICMTFRIF